MLEVFESDHREHPNTEFIHSYQISSLDDIAEQELGKVCFFRDTPEQFPILL